jgi:apolipoprotein N-acyltransferase
LLTKVRPHLLAVLSGVLYFLGFVGFDIWPLIFLFLAALLFAIEGASPRRAFLLGQISGTVAMFGGYYWVNHLLSNFAGLSAPLAFLGFTLLALYHGLSVAIAAWLVKTAEVRLEIPAFVSLPIAYSAVELVFPFIFPSYIGNSLYRVSILTQIVELFGMLGLTVLICLVNVAVFARKKRELAVAGGALLFTLVYGAIRIPMVESKIEQAKKLDVGIVQTNLGARDKAAKRGEFIRRHQQMTLDLLREEPGLDLIVWPESAYNRWIHRDEKNLRATVTDGITVPLIFGALTYDEGTRAEPERRTYNTAVATSSTGDVLQLFDKVELLVFGETLPFVDTFPQIKRWLPRSSTFTRGSRFVNFEVAGTELMPMICYEDIIPSFVRKMWRTAGIPEALVNVTNDSWYGDTHEPLIHLVLATFRSIETRRALIRSTNTGISAFVDPVGRMTKRSGQWTQETLVEEVPLIEDGSTTVYMMFGDVIGWLSLLAIVMGAFKAFGLKRRR